MQQMTIQVTKSDAGQRIDRFLSEQLQELNRSMAQKLCEQGLVLCGTKAVGKSYKLNGNELIEVSIPNPQPITIEPENIPINIVYEDESLLVVDKPKGMVVHPAPGHYSGTLVNALMWHCADSLSGINGVIRPGIVHRIDKDTSGLLIVAKGDEAHLHLAGQISRHSFTRRYEAMVYFGFTQDSGEVDEAIGRHPTNRKRMAVNGSAARQAKTLYTVLQRYEGYTHLGLELTTGRTHQIRVHMAHIGHPVVGDEVYGPSKVITRTKGQCLHAKTIGFIHPKSGEYMEFDSPLPDYFTGFVSQLKLK